MQLPTPFFREVGTGSGAVCLHANASSSSQWRALMGLLAPRFHVLAADSFGAAAALEAGDPGEAARCFIDFWMGEGSWARTPEPRRGPIAASMASVRGWEGALFEEPTPLAAFSRLEIPVLYMVGGRSPASSRGVARLLTGALPRVEVVELEELGHMGPLTHAEVVNDLVLRFLERGWPAGQT